MSPSLPTLCPEAAAHWVSSNRAVVVTVSLPLPASIGVGAGVLEEVGEGIA